MKYAKRRKSWKWLKTGIIIILPLGMSAVSYKMGMIKSTGHEGISLNENKTADAPPDIRETVTKATDEDFLSGSLILSQGYGIKPEIEQGENYLELVPPSEQFTDMPAWA